MSVAIEITGFDLTAETTETFYYSDIGFSAVINGSLHFYAPKLKDSILIKQELDDFNDVLSVRLINDSQLDLLDGYVFDGYSITVYVNLQDSPNPEKFYTIFQGKIDTLQVKRDSVDIKAKSLFASLEDDINPAVFTGVSNDFEGSDSAKDKNKPRVIGKVFNIPPVLIKPNTLVYGCNWDKDGNRDAVSSFDAVRDGGVDLDLEVAGGSGGDFATTALMDAYSPQAGYYVTCLAEGTFKLGSSPVYGVTCDVTQSAYTYQAWMQLIASETDITGFINHNVDNYVVGGYFERSIDYLGVNKLLAENRDIALWIDSTYNLNAKVLDNADSSAVNFVAAGLELNAVTDIPYLSLQRVKYDLPPKVCQLNYHKNYTTQGQSDLAGVTTDAEKELYKNEWTTTALDNTQTPDPYPVSKTTELESAIFSEADAVTELARWVTLRSSMTDTIQIKCKILQANEYIILGAIAEGAVNFVNVSNTDTLISDSTELISNNNTSYTPQTTLTLGSKVSVTDDRFGYNSKEFLITKIELNTVTMLMTYTLWGLR